MPIVTSVESGKAKFTKEYPPLILTFGGGINSHKRPADILVDECSDGENFDLDVNARSFRTRRAFDKLGTAPNAGKILGYAQLIKQNGTVSTLIQAATVVYTWDGANTFATIAETTATTARLRGKRDHNFTPDEKVIITDLNRVQKVSTWNGTTFEDLAHGLGVSLYAKYCFIHKERVFLANAKLDAVDTPHLLMGSETRTATTWDSGTRPSAALGLADPFILTTPDLRPINALEEAFGQFLISTEKGVVHVLSGDNAFNFAFTDLYVGSAVTGAESMVNIGNDVVMGLGHRIESLSGTINYGDVETNDLTIWIKDDIENVGSWAMAYDRRRQKVFCLPDNQSRLWVLHKALVDGAPGKGISPWAKWTTKHPIDMRPSIIFSLIDPITGADIVCMGDDSGVIYQLDGSNENDGSDTLYPLTVNRTSGMIKVDEGNIFDIEGWVDYRHMFAANLVLTFQWHGEQTPDQSITIKLPGASGTGVSRPVYNGEVYYNGSFWYSLSFSAKLYRQKFAPAGQGSYLSVKAEVVASGEWEVHEVGIRIKASQAIRIKASQA